MLNDDAVEAHKERTRGLPLTARRTPTWMAYSSVFLCLEHDPQYLTYEAGPFTRGPCKVCGKQTTRVYTVRR